MRRLLLILTCLALVGCAGIPDRGPVNEVGAVTGSVESTVRYAPAGPAKDASPEDVVRGYLDAMLAYPMTSGTAALFLTADAAGEWQSSEGVAIYVRPETVARPHADRSDGNGNPVAMIRLAVHEQARLDRQGNYQRTGVPRDIDFRLVRDRGQWRISNPQAGFLVSQKFFDDYYRPFNIYFFDAAGKRLLAEPVYVLVGDQLSTALMSSLLLGPPRSGAAAARSYIPPKTQLRTSVPLRLDGVADVQFRDDLSGLPGSSRDRAAAQIAWTLRQVPQVTRIQLTGGESSLLPAGVTAQLVDGWQEFGPRFGSGTFLGAQGNHVVQLLDRTIDDVGGAWKAAPEPLAALAVRAGKVAAVSADGESLIVGPLSKKGTVTTSGDNFLRPCWDDDGRVWALDTADGRSRLRIIDGKSVAGLKLDAAAERHIRSFALSPDMTRYAFIAGRGSRSRVYVGAIVRNDADKPVGLGAPMPLLAVSDAVTDIDSVSWATTTRVTFLADEGVVGRQVFEARIDGSMIVGGTARSGALLPNVKAVSLATTGGDNPVRYVIDAAGGVWMLRPGGAWERLPAGKFTALAAVID